MFARTRTSSSCEALESRLFLAAQYRIIDLGTLGGDSSVATALNDRGQVVGYSTTGNGQTRAFLYSNGRMRNLGSPKADSRAYDVNERGHVVGEFVNNSGSSRAFIWRRGFLTRLESLNKDGPRASVARAINDDGIIVGESAGRPTLWRREEARRLSKSDGTAFDINNDGRAGGSAGDLPSLFRPPLELDEDGAGRVLDLNERRLAAGWHSGAGDRQAVLWRLSASGEFVLDRTDLGGLADAPGDDLEFSVANAVNDAGRVVGASLTDDLATRHAFVWESAQMQDLNDLLEDEDSGWVLVSANDINNDGQIVGTGLIDGQEHAFLLEPIAEGADIALVHDGREIGDREGDPIDFGTVALNAPEPRREFIIRNEGRRNLRISDIDLPSGFRLLDELPDRLEPGEVESFRIAMATDQPGIRFGQVVITTNDPDERFFEFEVEGRVRPGFGSRPFQGFPTGPTGRD